MKYSFWATRFTCAFLTLGTVATLAAADRITRPLDNSRRVVLKGHIRPEVQPQNDQGVADADQEIGYATLLLNLDPSIEAFLEAQQTPGSANYRRWITPEQFGDRFGLNANDMAKVVGWLQSQGLKVNDVAKGRHWVTFSGTAAQVGRALRTEIHTYLANGERHFANATEPSIPEALQPVVGGFRGLNDFRPQPMLRMAPVQPPQDYGSASGIQPKYNSSGTHYLAPDDLATIFNISALYNAGIDGTGQKLVIAGETAVLMNDFKLFQTRFGLTPNLPQLMLFGTDPGVRATDLVEANLDLQWSTAVARNATIIYAYATNVFTAAQYAVDQNLGQQMSISYGACEAYESLAYRAVAQQANAQGMTIFVSSGDSAAATCDRNGQIPEAIHGATASWPSSIPEITSVGGTEFDDSGANYWAAGNNGSGASALSYIPEVPWNDSALTHQLEGGGGAPSVLFPKPAWQKGPGVPNDGVRDTPDISLPASPVKYAYLLESSGALAAVGGTSASSPAWAGIAALLNQFLTSKGMLAQPGLGNINPVLYRLAQATTDVFHDVATGDNRVPCAQSTPDCVDGMVGFYAGPGYDLATGLGSVNVFNLVNEWNFGTASTTTLSPSPANPGAADTVTLTATVQGGGAIPTGSVDFVISDISLGTATLVPASAGTATASISVTGNQILAGTGAVNALYSGDGVYAGSDGTATVSVTLPAGTGSYVVPWVTPNPVYQGGAQIWPYTVGLTEQRGVATTLTSFTVNGANNLSGFSTLAIPANGTIRANLNGSNLTVPLNRTFAFNGRDNDGTLWSKSITVQFLPPSGAPLLNPAISLSTTTPVVFQKAGGDSSCLWSQQLTVQETGGYYIVLSRLTVSGADYTSFLPVIFGTTRLAPYGVLQGTLCFASGTPTGAKTFVITGTVTDGQISGTLTSSTSATLSAATNAGSGIAPNPVTINVYDDSPLASATIDPSQFQVSGSWSATIAPNNRGSKWLTLSKAAGTGPISIQASKADLSSGVYLATVVVTANQIPYSVPVTLVVNPSSITSIAGVINNFSGSTTLAPGEMVAVYGTRMAPDTGAIIASTLPLPFSLKGVSATVNGVSAAMYYVSPGQIDLQIPYETGSGPAVLAINNNGNIAAFPLTMVATQPGLFNQAIDATTGALTSTVKQGQVVILYITGEGDVTPTLATGATPVRQTDPTRYPAPRQQLTVTVGDVPAAVLFSGIPNGIAAEMQINMIVPPNAPLGRQPMIVYVGGVPSQTVGVTVNPQ